MALCSLADHGVRKYDYETGRFISCDALWGEFLRWSPYQYGLNNPLRFIDFDGFEIILVGATPRQQKQWNDALRTAANWGSKTACDVIDKAKSSDYKIYVHFFAEDKPVSGNTPTHTKYPRSLQFYWNNSYDRRTETWIPRSYDPSGLTLRDGNTSDIIMDSDKLDRNTDVNREPLETSLNPLAIIDELNHATSNNSTAQMDHRLLFGSLLGEILNNTISPAGTIKGQIESKLTEVY